MNKGVIVQIEHNTAHILKNDGAFISCPCDPSWQIGDVVTIPRRSWLSLKAMIISCAAIFVFLISSGIFVYNVPSTYMEISVNPSMQMILNRFDRVLSVTGLNDEGNELLQGVSYKNLSLDEAYARLLNRLENNGYLNDATVQLVVANNSQRNMDGIERALRDISAKYIQANSMQMSIKRYANDEYLALSHPLPVVDIPDAGSQEPFEQAPAPSPSTMPHNRNRHDDNWHDGNWQNGWWDWDCGM